MLPFKVEFRPGEPPYREIAFAATRAIVSGILAPGSPFPSVRELSQELKINPNTAHKVVGELRGAGLLEVRPGIGTVVTDLPPPSPAERQALLTRPVEELVVEAARLGLTLSQLQDAVAERWSDLFGPGTEADKEADGEDRPELSSEPEESRAPHAHPAPEPSPAARSHTEPEPERR